MLHKWVGTCAQVSVCLPQWRMLRNVESETKTGSARLPHTKLQAEAEEAAVTLTNQEDHPHCQRPGKHWWTRHHLRLCIPVTWGICFRNVTASSKWSSCIFPEMSGFSKKTGTAKTTKPLLANSEARFSDMKVHRSKTAGNGPSPRREGFSK